MPHICIRCGKITGYKPTIEDMQAVPFAGLYCEKCIEIRKQEREGYLGVIENQPKE